jgi:hypothetical protein
MLVREEEDGIGERTGDFADVEVLYASPGRGPVGDPERPEKGEEGRAEGGSRVPPGRVVSGGR